MEYDFEVERDNMLKLISTYRDVAADDSDQLNDDGDISPVVDDDEEEEERNYQRRSERKGRSGKQVHFSSGLPSTRQSRCWTSG